MGDQAAFGGYCRRCGYALRGLSDPRCPECGRAFDPRRRSSFHPHPWQHRARRRARRVAILFLCVVAASVVGWGWLYLGWRREQGAIHALRASGAKVAVRYVGPAAVRDALGPRLGFVLERADVVYRGILRFTDKEAQHLPALSGVREVDLSGAQVTDAAAAYFDGLGRLETLDVGGTSLTGTGLRRLATSQTTLEVLRINDSQITDGDLAHLKYFRKLRVLDVSGTRLTDRGLVHLLEVPGLEKLNLSDTQITGASLATVTQLPRLRVLSVADTRVTGEDLARLNGNATLKTLYLSDGQVDVAGSNNLRRLPALRGVLVHGDWSVHRPWLSLRGVTVGQYSLLEGYGDSEIDGTRQ